MPGELERIQQGGGVVALGRIKGSMLQTSRGIGDWELKESGLYIKLIRQNYNPIFNLEETRKYKVTPIPSVTKTFKTNDMKMLIIGEKSMWDVHHNKDVFDISEKAK